MNIHRDRRRPIESAFPFKGAARAPGLSGWQISPSIPTISTPSRAASAPATPSSRRSPRAAASCESGFVREGTRQRRARGHPTGSRQEGAPTMSRRAEAQARQDLLHLERIAQRIDGKWGLESAA